jgi:hypothetical protein
MPTPKENFVEMMRMDPTSAEPILLKMLADPMAEQLLLELCAEPGATDALVTMCMQSEAVSQAVDRVRKEN